MDVPHTGSDLGGHGHADGLSADVKDRPLHAERIEVLQGLFNGAVFGKAGLFVFGTFRPGCLFAFAGRLARLEWFCRSPVVHPEFFHLQGVCHIFAGDFPQFEVGVGAAESGNVVPFFAVGGSGQVRQAFGGIEVVAVATVLRETDPFWCGLVKIIPQNLCPRLVYQAKFQRPACFAGINDNQVKRLARIVAPKREGVPLAAPLPVIIAKQESIVQGDFRTVFFAEQVDVCKGGVAAHIARFGYRVCHGNPV